MEIYEEHFKACTHLNQKGDPKKGLHYHHEMKQLQKKNENLTSLVKNFPAFTKIFR